MKKSKRILTSILILTLSILMSSVFMSFHEISNSKGISSLAIVKSINKSEYVIPVDTTGKEIYKIVEDMPRFSGCEDVEDQSERKKCAHKKMLEFIYSNIEYPAEAKANSIEGTVVVQMIVAKSGELEEIKVVRSIGSGCEEESLRVVRMMPDWISGKQRGTAVDVQFNLPIQFKPEMKDFKNEHSTEKESPQVVENMPRFPGCEHLGTEAEILKCAQMKMLQFIYQNIEYPEKARRKSVEGTVVVRFTVEKDGSFDNVEAVRTIGAGCDEESVRVINTMPKWIPGKQRGKPVNVEFNLPIKFKLDKKTLKKNKKRDKKNSRQNNG